MTLSAAPSVLDSSLFIPELRPRRKDAVLVELVARVHRSGVTREPELLLNLLRAREKVGTTAVGKGVAIPNARSLLVSRPQLLVARSRRGVEWGSEDGLPATIILLALSPGEWSEEAHHAFLGRAAAVARLQRNRQKLLEAKSFATVAHVLREVEAP